jgi:hypothetical protein
MISATGNGSRDEIIAKENHYCSWSADIAEKQPFI